MNISIWHTVILLATVVFTVALDITALAQTWRDVRRSLVAKLVWTAVIVVLPLIGGIGWAINWSLGRAAEKLSKNANQ
jgi:hypothetical protein